MMSERTGNGYKPVSDRFHPVVRIGKTYRVLDLSAGYNPSSISLDPPSIGKWNERRSNMYTTTLFEGRRNIHMGLDFWVPAGTPVCSFADGEILFFRDNSRPGDYGPTIVTRHRLPRNLPVFGGAVHDKTLQKDQKMENNAYSVDNIASQTGQILPEMDGPDFAILYALFGHLDRKSLERFKPGDPLSAGQQIGQVGEEHENGGWAPHLHLQFSIVRPDKPDMPGVVSDDAHQKALRIYPDPQLLLGRFYPAG